MILNAIAEKLKLQSKDDFKGRHFEAWFIVQALAWYLRYPHSYRDLEGMFRDRGFEVDHCTVNRWANEPLLSPEKIGTDGANTFPSAIKTSVDDRFGFAPAPKSITNDT